MILDLAKLEKDIKVVADDGKNMILNDDADKAIAVIIKAKKQIDEALKLIKPAVAEALQPFNATTVRGRYCTISIGQPRGTSKYAVDEEAKTYLIKKVTYVPDVEKIEKFIERRNQMPFGVHPVTVKPVISIRAKDVESDEN